MSDALNVLLPHLEDCKCFHVVRDVAGRGAGDVRHPGPDSGSGRRGDAALVGTGDAQPSKLGGGASGGGLVLWTRIWSQLGRMG